MKPSTFCGAVVHLAMAFMLSACRSESPSSPPPRPESHAAKADTGVSRTELRIDHEMLRDLRITTSKVQEHRGGDSSSLLG